MATKRALHLNLLGAASDIDSTPESPTMGSSVLHSPSSTLNVNVKGTWSINTSDSSIIYPHAAMNSVTPENKKRKQQQQDSRTDEEGEFFSFSRRKNTCAGSDHIKTEGCGSGTNSYLSQIDFRKDEDSCSSDSGTDEEAKKHNGQSSGMVPYLYKSFKMNEDVCMRTIVKFILQLLLSVIMNHI